MSGLMIPPREYHGEVITYGPHVPDPELDAWKSRDDLTTQAEYADAGGYILDVTIDGKRSVIDFQTLKLAEIRKLLPKAKRTRRAPATKQQDAPQREETPKMTAATPVMPCPFCDATFALEATAAFRDHLTVHMVTPAPATVPHLTQVTTVPAPRATEPGITLNVTPIRRNGPSYSTDSQPNPTRAAVLDTPTWTPPTERPTNSSLNDPAETQRVAAWCAAHHLPAYIVGRWVWIQFDAKPDDATRDLIKAEGFRWVQTRKAWAHHCGYRSKKGSVDPRIKYGMVPVSDDRDGMAAD